jgi:hypothetical protein
MQFEYEISDDDYVASQTLYLKLSNGGNNRVRRASPWILAGIFFLVVTWNERVLGWPSILLTGIGVWWIYAGTLSLFPGRHLRREYQGLQLAGKKFQAEVNEEGFEVVGDLRSWRVQWAGVTLKGENEHAFVLYSVGTVFMFGKKYLAAEQQQELRRLAALAAP